MGKFPKVLTATASLAVSICLLTPHAEALEKGRPVSPDDQQAQTVVLVPGCTATAIDEHWVLLAKHCMGKQGPANYNIHIGTTTANRPVVKGTEGFWAPAGDLALIKVPGGIGLDHYASLPESPLPKGEIGKAYGWGRGTGSTLATAESKIGGTYRFPGTYNNGLMFSSVHQNGALPQPGDSGGPLFIGNTVVGVASSKGAENNPTANYADVYSQRDWIMEHIESTKPAPEEPTTPDPLPNPETPEQPTTSGSSGFFSKSFKSFFTWLTSLGFRSQGFGSS